MFIIFSVFYILVAAAMIVLILIQRGEGANAGASFGGGSSGTVFGASGSASFLGRATGVLFTLFIALSLGMAIHLSHTGAPTPASDLGVMSGVSTTTSKTPAKSDAKPAQGESATAVPKAAIPSAPATPAASDTGDKDQAAQNSAVPQPTTTDKSSKQPTSGKDQGSSEPKKK